MYVSLWTWADYWPGTPYPESLFAWALHGETQSLVTPADPLAPGEWFEVQVTGVRLEDAGRMHPDMEGLLRLRLRAPWSIPGDSAMILPQAAESGYIGTGSPLPAAGR
jgi:hypothetical protein